MSNFQTLNLEQIHKILKSIMEYTRLFVLLIKKHVKHVLWKLYIWRESNQNLETPRSLFHFSLVLSNFLLLIMPHTLLHAFLQVWRFLCVCTSRNSWNIYNLQIPLWHIGIIIFPALLYIPLLINHITVIDFWSLLSIKLRSSEN